MNPFAQEQRVHARVACEILDSQRQLIRNISRGGVYFESDRSYDLGEDLQLDFSVPISGQQLQLDATVIRQQTLSPNRYGYAVRFQGLSPEENKAIDELRRSEEYYAKVKEVFLQIIPDEVKSNFSHQSSIIDDLHVDSLKVAEAAILLEQSFGQSIFLPDWFVSEENPEDLKIGSLIRFLMHTLKSLN